MELLRRCPNQPPKDWTNPFDPAYRYGPAQKGDIIGPWLALDIAFALDLSQAILECQAE